MASTTLSKMYDNSTDANFKDWAQSISNQLAACGWTLVADSGKINWGTAVRPTVANTSQGYEIWAPNDTLQATDPYMVKIEYGGGASPLYPSVWLTMGNGSNGAGTLNGSVTPRAQLQAGGNIASVQNHKFAGANNRFVCALAPEYNNAVNMISFGFERTHDNTGADTGAALLMFGIGSAVKTQTVCPGVGTGAAPAQELGLGALTPLSAASVRGTQFGIYPIFPFLGAMLNPLRNALVYFNNEITAHVNITGTHYGAATTLYTCGGSVGSFSKGSGTDATNSRLAIRFE
jgi:hypothetical protein